MENTALANEIIETILSCRGDGDLLASCRNFYGESPEKSKLFDQLKGLPEQQLLESLMKNKRQIALSNEIIESVLACDGEKTLLAAYRDFYGKCPEESKLFAQYEKLQRPQLLDLLDQNKGESRRFVSLEELRKKIIRKDIRRDLAETLA